MVRLRAALPHYPPARKFSSRVTVSYGSFAVFRRSFAPRITAECSECRTCLCPCAIRLTRTGMTSASTCVESLDLSVCKIGCTGAGGTRYQGATTFRRVGPCGLRGMTCSSWP